jgi:hypothetical protein
MKKQNIAIGMDVVVNDLPDAVVYTVSDLVDRQAKLTYKSKDQTLSAGRIAVGCLMKPKSYQKK